MADGVLAPNDLINGGVMVGFNNVLMLNGDIMFIFFT
jgi:hypothetical protein